MIEFLTYTIVSIFLLAIGFLLIINMLLANISNSLEKIHELHNNFLDKE